MNAGIPRRAWVEQIMGMPISVHVRGADPVGEDVEERVAAVFADLCHADAVLSPYRDDSDLSRWERGDLALGEADPALAEVMALCDLARARTNGRFDPRDLPDPRGGGPRYDPSGLVKGWAVERAARHLAGLDGAGWCVNAGGDVVVHAPAGQAPWRVGIEDPEDPGRVTQVVRLRSGAVATSGTAHRGAHIIDPHTGRPAEAVRAVTVTGPRLMWADVYATAAAVQGPDATDWLDGQDGYEAFLTTVERDTHTTRGWPAPPPKRWPGMIRCSSSPGLLA
ncbi:FAD:protein FMN transferase [Spirillospora sp. CA-142024]|uniref:FAD:protein FMN transferase n=1 Tax=Spirillospora sp. CA-142024 TaxID=3240036 RepID=UPI003D8CFFF3